MAELTSGSQVIGTNLGYNALGQGVSACDPEQMLDAALGALSAAGDWRAVIDRLPVPIYTTDAAGAVTYWNRACVEFAGRVPELGEDRWCVTWQLYTTNGELMPPDECPMAEAVRERRQVRDKVAIALRPDGSRVAFRAYPVPLFGGEGELTGAINMLVDVSDEQAAALATQARQCRRLSGATFTREVCAMLDTMAESYEQAAEQLSKGRRR